MDEEERDEVFQDFMDEHEKKARDISTLELTWQRIAPCHAMLKLITLG